MKPHGVIGVELTSVSEAFALGTILTDAQNLVPEDNQYFPVLEPTAAYVTGRAEAHIMAHGEDADAPFSIIFPEEMGAGMVRMLIRVAADTHPDPALRQTAADMQASYAQAVFEGAMSDTPPPADPEQYRSPFAD